MDQKSLTTTIEVELLRKIKILAGGDDIRASELLEEVIHLFLEKYKKTS